MKKILTYAIILIANIALAQEFTNSVKVNTWTNAIIGIMNPVTSNQDLNIRYDGSKEYGRATLQGTNNLGQPITMVIRTEVGVSDLLKAGNSTAGIVMDANATNIFKKRDKISLKAHQKDANKQLDALSN